MIYPLIMAKDSKLSSWNTILGSAVSTNRMTLHTSAAWRSFSLATLRLPQKGVSAPPGLSVVTRISYLAT